MQSNEVPKMKKKKPPLRWGDARAQFVKNLDFIMAQARQGVAYTQIWENARATLGVTMTRSAFYRIIKQYDTTELAGPSSPAEDQPTQLPVPL